MNKITKIIISSLVALALILCAAYFINENKEKIYAEFYPMETIRTIVEKDGTSNKSNIKINTTFVHSISNLTNHAINDKPIFLNVYNNKGEKIVSAKRIDPGTQISIKKFKQSKISIELVRTNPGDYIITAS
jgi:hypothetical protein